MMGSFKRLMADRFFRTMGISLLLHIAIVLLLSLNPMPLFIKIQPTAYTVTLMPVIPEPEPSKPAPVEEPKIVLPKEEKTKPPEKPKKEDIVEKVKKTVNKPEESLEKKKESLDRLHEALDEVRKKVALDQIQKKVAKREDPAPTPPPFVPPSPSSIPPSPIPSPASPVPPSPLPSSDPPSESRLIEYYSLIMGKIKSSWTIPKNLFREGIDFETTIVIIVDQEGNVRKSWFEKKSGNDLYDQMAMRAIKKAEPFSPIPKDFGKETLEFEIRFSPD